MIGGDDRLRFDATGKPEFDDWRWVDYWSPVREVIYFKRLVYARALGELALAAFPAGVPPYPEWWSEDLLRQPATSDRGRAAGASRRPARQVLEGATE
jgi:putative (di)nucleoside polyphosphate hydrolase